MTAAPAGVTRRSSTATSGSGCASLRGRRSSCSASAASRTCASRRRRRGQHALGDLLPEPGAAADAARRARAAARRLRGSGSRAAARPPGTRTGCTRWRSRPTRPATRSVGRWVVPVVVDGRRSGDRGDAHGGRAPVAALVLAARPARRARARAAAAARSAARGAGGVGARRASRSRRPARRGSAGSCTAGRPYRRDSSRWSALTVRGRGSRSRCSTCGATGASSPARRSACSRSTRGSRSSARSATAYVLAGVARVGGARGDRHLARGGGALLVAVVAGGILLGEAPERGALRRTRGAPPDEQPRGAAEQERGEHRGDDHDAGRARSGPLAVVAAPDAVVDTFTPAFAARRCTAVVAAVASPPGVALDRNLRQLGVGGRACRASAS